MDIAFQHSTFTASEAEAITGMNLAQQRNHRRAGYLDRGEGGWTRHTVFDLAQMAIMQMLAARGVGPAISAPIGKSAAVLVAGFAFGLPGAVEDDHGFAHGEEPLKMPEEARRQRFLVVHGLDASGFAHVESLDRFYQGRVSDDFEVSAAIVLDLHRIAVGMYRAADKPFTRVVAA